MKIKKTNAMRILDQHKIIYDIETYEFDDEDVTGKKYHEVKENTFKTLVLKGDKKGLKRLLKGDFLRSCLNFITELILSFTLFFFGIFDALFNLFLLFFFDNSPLLTSKE